MMIGGPGLKKLAQFCNQLGTMLNSGIPIARAMEILKKRGIAKDMRSVVSKISNDINGGTSLHQSLVNRGRIFPPLMLNLVRVGEESGNLDNVLKRLGDYYEMLRQVRTRFLTKLVYPAIQLFLAIVVLSIVSFVFAMLQESGSPEAAFIRTFSIGMGTIAAIVTLYFVVTRVMTQWRGVQEVLLKTPIIGAVRRNMAFALFSWSMEMMIRAGANIEDALSRSLESTDNGAFTARIPGVLAKLEGGGSVSESIESTGLFPVDFIEIIEVGEQAGSMDDAFERLSKLHFERSETAMSVFSTVFAYFIWACVAGLIIYLIFMFAMQYVRMISDII